MQSFKYIFLRPERRTMFILKINLLYFKAVFLLSVNIVSNEKDFSHLNTMSISTHRLW